jgi:HemY protein
MFIRLVWLILLVLVAGALASWLASQPGMLQLEWLGYQLEMRTSLAVALVLVLGLIVIFADRLLRGLLDLPGLLGRNLARRRAAQGHRALALGMIAVSAGEPAEASRQASRAQRLLSAPQLTDLLSAQAANLSGDHRAAGRYFTSLTGNADTAFLGHIGLARLALEDDRSDDALAEAQKALSLRPKSALAARQVMVLQAERGNWDAALPALNVMALNVPTPQMKAPNMKAPNTKAGADDEDAQVIARHRAALNFLLAREGVPEFMGAESTGGGFMETGSSGPVHSSTVHSSTVNQLQTALAAWPAFWPAAILLADIHLAAAAPRKAVKSLEAAFRVMPHAAIATRLQTAWNSNEGKTVARLLKLVAASGDTAHEARSVVAAVALAHGLTGEAGRLIGEIPDAERDAATWRLAAQLAESGDNPDPAAANKALRMAGEAPRPRRWQCTSCQQLHDRWQAHCAGCAGFATLDWRRPDGLSPLVSNSNADDRLAAPPRPD